MPTKLCGIEILNFKTFCGLKSDIITTNDFNFLGIIGENESGKLNLMNAIAFALDESIENLGCKNVADFEYKDILGNKNQTGNTFVAVKLKSENGVEEIFKRCIIDNKSHYFVNNQEISRDLYVNFIENKYKINLNRIFFHQGMINTIINQSSNEKSQTFEELSNSINFKSKYDNLKAQLNIYDTELSNLNDKIEPLLEEKDKLICYAPGNEILWQLEEKFKERYYLFAIHQKEKYLKKLREGGYDIWEKIIKRSIAEITKLIENILTFKKNHQQENNKERKNNIIDVSSMTYVNSIETFNKLLESDGDGFDEIYDNLKKLPGKEYQCKSYKDNRLKLNEKVDDFMKVIFDMDFFQHISLTIEGGKFEFKIHDFKLDNSKYVQDQNRIMIEAIQRCNKALDLGKKYQESYDIFVRKKTEIFKEKGDLIREAIDNNVKCIGETLMKNVYKPRYEKREFDLDFSILPDKLLNVTDENEAIKMKNNLQNDIDSVRKIIHKNAMSASKDKLDKLNNKIKIYVDEKIKIKINSKMANKQLNIVKNIRKNCFKKYLDCVEKKINEIYKILGGQDFGQVKIIVYNEDEPYLDGIQFEFNGQLFSCLSKKNKTIAAIAILFAQQLDLSAGSFIFINEIDNQLGDKHVSCLMNYLGQIKNQQQIILTQKYQQTKFISEHADVLIRIVKGNEGSDFVIIKP